MWGRSAKLANMTTPNRCVFDASAMLSFILNREGADVVAACLDDSVMHATTWTEMLTQLSRVENVMHPDQVAAGLKKRLIIDVGQPEDAERAGALSNLGPRSGLSLGDRYTLAIAARLGLPIVTAHRHWTELDLSNLGNTPKIYSLRK